MPVLKASLVDVTASPSTATEVVVRADGGRVSGTRVVVEAPHRVPVKGGDFSVNLVPGRAHLVVVHGGRPVEHIPLIVTDGMTQLVEAVRLADESWGEWSPTQSEQIKAEVAGMAATVAEGAGQTQRLAVSASRSAESAGIYAEDAQRSANAANLSASIADGIAKSTSWSGDRLTVNGITSPALTGPQGERGPQGATGARGPQGVQGPPGEVTRAQLDTAVAAQQARMLGVMWGAVTEDDAKALEPKCQKGDFIQVAQTGNIYKVV